MATTMATPMAMASFMATLPRLEHPPMRPPIASLPPELLDAVFSTFPTPALLPLAAVNRRFHNIIARLLYRRLRHALASSTHELILECYHPSAKIPTPYLHCAYAGTDGLDQLTDDIEDVPGTTLLRLPGMYSRFRPIPPDERDVHVRNYRAIRRTMNFFRFSDASAATAGSVTTPAMAVPTAAAPSSASPASPAPLVSYDVSLDEGELFSQLCTRASLVRNGPRRGLFLSCASIDDGVIRVWRDWLAKKSGGGDMKKESKKETREDLTDPKQDAVLWAYTGKHMGMRFRVTATAAADAAAAAVPGPAGDEVAVSYQLEYEELLVRTYEYLLAMEEAEAQEVSHSSTVIVMSSL